MKDTYESSPQLMTVDGKRGSIGREPKYPWRTMSVGTSFVVRHSEVKLSTMLSYSSLMGRRTGRKFRVVDHGMSVGIEIARVG